MPVHTIISNGRIETWFTFSILQRYSIWKRFVICIICCITSCARASIYASLISWSTCIFRVHSRTVSAIAHIIGIYLFHGGAVRIPSFSYSGQLMNDHIFDAFTGNIFSTSKNQFRIVHSSYLSVE